MSAQCEKLSSLFRFHLFTDLILIVVSVLVVFLVGVWWVTWLIIGMDSALLILFAILQNRHRCRAGIS